jgi:uncharacterized membrane protein
MHDDQHIVHRLESFSDIVIGFSLALLALSLSIPAHITDLITNPWWLIAYFWSFAVISGLWYNHRRLFSSYFVADSFSVGINFVLLSMIGLVVYFVQVFVHEHSDYDRTWAFLAYFIAQGCAFLCLGTLYAYGARRRWATLDPQARFIGVRQGARGLVGGVFVLTGVAVSALHPARSMADTWPVAAVALAGLVGVRIVLRFMKPKVMEAAHA